MTDAGAAASWVLRYVEAWTSNDPDQIAALFTEDGEYRTAPYAPPWVGHDQIVVEWLANKDEPGTWSFSFEIVAVDGDTAFMEGTTVYADSEAAKSRTYRNLWVIQLAEDGRCRRFTEWYMREPA